MITLQRDGVTMEVCTELQASVFERNGYTRVDAVANDPVPVEEPKRRRRKTKVEAEEASA